MKQNFKQEDSAFHLGKNTIAVHEYLRGCPYWKTSFCKNIYIQNRDVDDAARWGTNKIYERCVRKHKSQ